jgi:hypothetical protein
MRKLMLQDAKPKFWDNVIFQTDDNHLRIFLILPTQRYWFSNVAAENMKKNQSKLSAVVCKIFNLKNFIFDFGKGNLEIKKNWAYVKKAVSEFMNKTKCFSKKGKKISTGRLKYSTILLVTPIIK